MNAHPYSAEAAAHRARLAADPNRPRYHFTAPQNWMNDPNGLFWWKGRLHLFYQHQPETPHWGVMHWGHAVSDDLIHWRDLPIAMSPTIGGHDAGGVWSGCCVDNGGTPTIFYTGASGEFLNPRQQVILMATADPADDDLIMWTKQPRTHVPYPEAYDLIGYRDPNVWREGEGASAQWMMTVGAGVRGQGGGGGCVFLYRSPDLQTWELVGPLLQHYDIAALTNIDLGILWECPQLLRFEDDAAALILNPWNGDPDTGVGAGMYTVYVSGTYKDGHFTPVHVDYVDGGLNCFYAPLAVQSPDLKQTWLWGWLRETCDNDAQAKAGWSGALSLPREVSFRGSKLFQMPYNGADDQFGHPASQIGFRLYPAPNFAALYKHPGQNILDIQLQDTPQTILERTFPNCVRIVVISSISKLSHYPFEVSFYVGKNGFHVHFVDEEEIIFQEHKFRLPVSPLSYARIDARYGSHLIDCFIDGSLIEIFVGGLVFSERIYSADNSLVSAFAKGVKGDSLSASAYEVSSIWSSPSG